MRIAYDVRSLQQQATRLQGIGSVTRSQLEAVSRIDAENEYRLVRWPGGLEPELDLGQGFRWSWLESKPCRVSHAGWWTDARRLSGLLAGQVDIFHCTSPFDLHHGWPVHPPDGMRTVVTVYDMMPVLQASVVLKGFRRLALPAFRRMARNLAHADALLCISTATADDLRQVLGQSLPQVRVVSLGTSDAFRVHADGEIEALRRRLSLPEDFLLFVGAPRPNKNLPALVQALSALPQVPRLVIATNCEVGPGHPLRALAEDLGVEARLQVLNSLPTPDLACLYSAARIVALPSLAEGYGLPVAEAMASGTAVVCSDLAALRETGGDAVRFCEPGRVDDLAEAIREVWEDNARREAMRRRGLERAVTQRWSETARQLLEAYRRVCGSKG